MGTGSVIIKETVTGVLQSCLQSITKVDGGPGSHAACSSIIHFHIVCKLVYTVVRISMEANVND